MYNLPKKTYLGVLSSIVASLAIGAITYLIRVILASKLSIADYGFIYAAFAMFSICEAIFDLGIGASGSIIMAKQDTKEKLNSIYSTFFLSRVFFSLVFALLFIFFAKGISLNYFHRANDVTTIIALALWLTFITLMGGNLIVLDILKDYKARNTLQVIPFVFIISALHTASSITPAKTAKIYAASVLTSYLLSQLYLKQLQGIKVKITWKRYTHNLKEIVHFSKWVAVSTAGMTIMFNMDSLMLVKLSGLKEVGLYNGALPIAQIPLTIMAFVPKVFIPHIAQLSISSPNKLGSMVKRFQLFIFIPCIIGLCIGYFIIEDIILLFFKKEFLGASKAAFILCSAIPFYAMALIEIGYQQSTGKQKRAAFVIILGLLINFGFNLTLIPHLGINGAATATFITYLSIFVGLKYFGPLKN